MTDADALPFATDHIPAPAEHRPYKVAIQQEDALIVQEDNNTDAWIQAANPREVRR